MDQQKIQIVKPEAALLRDLWRKEDKDFTKWLEENIDYLNEKLDFDITIESREEKVGPYRVDLYGEDNFGNKVIIENQLDKTDHTHLGQILTYLINLEAKTAIWITSKPMEEHIRVVDWLNETTPDDISFYLIKIEAIKIEPHPFAIPIFSIVKGPTRESKKIGDEKREYAQRYILRKEFWSQLLEKAKSHTKLHSNVSPSKDNWITAGAGKSGMGWSYSITMGKGSVELYIDQGPDKEDETNKIYEVISKDRERIENTFGEALEWDKKEGRRVCRIKSHSKIGGLKDADLWPEIQDDMIDRMKRLEQALRPSLKKI